MGKKFDSKMMIDLCKNYIQNNQETQMKFRKEFLKLVRTVKKAMDDKSLSKEHGYQILRYTLAVEIQHQFSILLQVQLGTK